MGSLWDQLVGLLVGFSLNRFVSPVVQRTLRLVELSFAFWASSLQPHVYWLTCA